MILADILFYFLIVVGFYLIFQSYWLVSEALFPRFVEHCRRKYAQTPIFSLFVGFVFTMPILIVGIILLTRMGNGLLQIIGILIILTLILLGLIGSTGLCRQIGLGLAGQSDQVQPWKRVYRGGLILGLTFIMPILGWFAIMPLVLISGIGVLLQAAWSKEESDKVI